MFWKKILCVLFVVFAAEAMLWAGDTVVFADLGFSPDGKIYMFGQYGVQAGTLRPWAEIFVVDVERNNFVPGGRLSFTHNEPIAAGQDGSGALYRLIAANSAIAERHRVNFLLQGKPLYISLDDPHDLPPGVVEFRDFKSGAEYSASLISSMEGSGANLRSSFYINLRRMLSNGSVRSYTVGTPQVKRLGIVSYRIRNVLLSPSDNSMIMVIEMKRQSGSGFDFRYMVEALRL